MPSNKGRYMMRRSALISPWGVGAIVPFPNDDIFMIAGLDWWEYKDNPQEFRITDSRLQRYLHVRELRLPPDYRESETGSSSFGLTIPVFRFPTLFYCPFCGEMADTSLGTDKPMCHAKKWTNGRSCSKPRKMIPERFVVVCPSGHIDDVPIMAILHNGNPKPSPADKHIVRRSTGGVSADISSVIYRCTCGEIVSIAPYMRKGALQKNGYTCTGKRPWLGGNRETCTANPEDLQIVLRGATNVWFANTISSLYIPSELPEESKINEIIDKKLDFIKCLNEYHDFNRETSDRLARSEGIKDTELFFEKCNEALNKSNEEIEISESEYRFQEYNVLCHSSGKASDEFFSVKLNIDEFNSQIRKYFTSITLVHKLKETRAFIGFSRLNPDSNKPLSEKKKDLRLGKESWLPAIQVSGEGIFFRFNEQEIKQWASLPSVKTRIALLDASLKKKPKNNLEGSLSPEFILIHSFAHLIINQLSYECGYGSSALRERIYCQKTSGSSEPPLNMYGLLIYTASGDSEGSLGGLVRQGKPGRLEDTILNALQTATWCTSDPVCIQSKGQGPDSLNLAACHNCALLPETCCENGNRFLDRGIVVGTLEDKILGYFKDLVTDTSLVE